MSQTPKKRKNNSVLLLNHTIASENMKIIYLLISRYLKNIPKKQEKCKIMKIKYVDGKVLDFLYVFEYFE